jgi:hypothetical protein
VAFRVRLTAAERTLLDEKAASGVNLSQLIRSAVLGYRLPSPPIVREAGASCTGSASTSIS